MGDSGKLPTIIRRSRAPKHINEVLCVGCGAHVVPGFCYTGSIITGLAFTSHNVEEPGAVLATWQEGGRVVDAILGDPVQVTKRVAFYKREKGPLCDRCASIPGCVEDRQGRKHEIVKVDARAGFIGQTILPVYE